MTGNRFPNFEGGKIEFVYNFVEIGPLLLLSEYRRLMRKPGIDSWEFLDLLKSETQIIEISTFTTFRNN